MCGLWGWQWKANMQPTKEARRELGRVLATEMDKRGGQSWGMFAPDLVMRGMGPAAPHHTRFCWLMSMFGHSRWATHGTNKLENTHPFVKDGVALAHNGVLSNHAELNTANQRQHVVDSEHLLSHLLENKPFTEIQGYGTICWFMPNEPGSLYFARLDERGPLTVYECEQGTVWASTEKAVQEAMAAARLTPTKEIQIDPGVAYFVQRGEVFRDPDFPSLRISATPTPSWESYGDYSARRGYRDYQSSYTSGGRTGDVSEFWCNLHKLSYAHCTCRGRHHKHIFKLNTGVTLTPGQECTAAQGEPGKGSEEPISLPEPHFCPANACYERYGQCKWHNTDGTALKRYDGPPTSTQTELTLVNQLQAEQDEQEREDEVEELVLDMARQHLEGVGINGYMTAGLSDKDVMNMAMEEGFDVVDAVCEAELMVNEEPEHGDTEAEAEAGVQQPNTGDESTHWGEAGLVGGGAED